MKIKFCGIRRMEDVAFCNTLKPDYMGMILSEGFRRTVPLETARKLSESRKPGIAAVGVFVNASPVQIAEVLRQVPLDVIQLHGSETAEIVSGVRWRTGLPPHNPKTDGDYRFPETPSPLTGTCQVPVVHHLRILPSFLFHSVFCILCFPGIIMVTVVPCPGVLFTSIVPPTIYFRRKRTFFIPTDSCPDAFAMSNPSPSSEISMMLSPFSAHVCRMTVPP